MDELELSLSDLMLLEKSYREKLRKIVNLRHGMQDESRVGRSNLMKDIEGAIKQTGESFTVRNIRELVQGANVSQIHAIIHKMKKTGHVINITRKAGSKSVIYKYKEADDKKENQEKSQS